MTHSRWFLLSMILLVFATVFGLHHLDQNINDHTELEKNTCVMALANRLVLRDLSRSVANDPVAPDSIRTYFAFAEGRLNELIKDTKGCKVN